MPAPVRRKEIFGPNGLGSSPCQPPLELADDAREDVDPLGDGLLVHRRVAEDEATRARVADAVGRHWIDGYPGAAAWPAAFGILFIGLAQAGLGLCTLAVVAIALN